MDNNITDEQRAALENGKIPGLPLEEVVRITEKARDNIFTIGLAIGPGTHPVTGALTFELPDDAIEYGLGLHGEPGVERTTMKPATRRLIAVKPADAAATEEIFDVLLGNNLAGRKAFIAEHANEYMKDADI